MSINIDYLFPNKKELCKLSYKMILQHSILKKGKLNVDLMHISKLILNHKFHNKSQYYVQKNIVFLCKFLTDLIIHDIGDVFIDKFKILFVTTEEDISYLYRHYK